MTLRVAVWAAVSSRAQVENKDSLASQKRDGRLWADQVDGRVTQVLEVPGHSRSHIFFQDAAAVIPAYGKLRRACEERAFDVLWCRSRDRLGRTDALIAQVEALVTNAGATVYSALMPSPIEDCSPASSIYMSAIERAQSEVEQVQRVQRTRVGQKARVRNGLPHAGVPPYGYAYVRDPEGKVVCLAPDPAEAGALAIIAEQYLQGHGVRRLVNALDASPFAPRHAKHWNRSTVRDMLENPTYAGYVRYNDLVVKSDKIEPLWDEVTWRAIQRELETRHPGGREIATALSGLCICRRCGRPMSHLSSASYDYYRCTTHAHRSHTGESCHPNNVRELRIARVLSEALAQVLQGEIAIEDLIQTASPDLARLEAEQEQLQREMTAIEEKRKRLALALAEGVMEPGPYRAADEDLVTALEQVLTRGRALDRQIAAQPTAAERETAVGRLRAYWGEDGGAWLLQDEGKHTMNASLRRLGVRIYCEDRRVVRIGFLN